MSKVLDIANNQFALLSGVSIPQVINTADANNPVWPTPPESD